MSYSIYILHPAEDSRVLVMGSGAVCQGVYRYKDKAPDPVPCSGWDFLVPRLWCHMPVPPTTASFYSLKVSCPRRGHSQEGRFPYWHKGVRGVLPVPPTTASFCSLKVSCPRRGHSHIRRGLHSLGLTGTTGSGLRPRAQMFQKPMIFEQICILSPLISTQMVQFLNVKICPALWK